MMNTAHKDGYAETIKAGRPSMLAVMMINIGVNAIVHYAWKAGTVMDKIGIMITTFKPHEGN